MKNIHTFSKLNKGYQLVKSWLLAGCYGLPILITTLLLTLGTGQMWAWYLPGTLRGEWNVTSNNMGSDNSITFYAVAGNTYKFKLTDGTNWSGDDLIKSTSGVTNKGTDGDGNMQISFSGVKDITITVTASWQLSVTASDPTYHIKYNWNTSGLSWVQLTPNGDGTYSCNGLYRANTKAFYYIKKSSDSDDGVNYNNGTSGVTLEKEPAGGDNCVFMFRPSNNSLTITRCNKVTKTNYIYFYNADDILPTPHKYFVIGHDKPTAFSKVIDGYYSTNIPHTKLAHWRNTTDTWNDATYYAFCSPSSEWANGDWGSSNLSNAGHYTAAFTNKQDLASGKYYMAIPFSGAGNGGSFSMEQQDSYTAFNKSQYVTRIVLNNEATNFANSNDNSVGSVSITGWYLYTAGGCSSNTAEVGSNESNHVSAAYSGDVTYTAVPGSGYTFAGWYSTKPTTLGTGTLLSTDLEYTREAPYGTSNVYAAFIQETSHDVTIQEYCTSTSTEISSSVRAIGEYSYTEITAPEIYGYTFVNWTKGTGLDLKAGDALTSSTIHVKTNTSGSGYTLQANYTEDLSSPWYVSGESTAIFGGWGDSGRNMQRKSGHSAEKRFYYTIDATKVINGDVSDSDLEFKIYNNSNDTYRGNSGYWVTRANYQPELSSSSGSNMQFRPDAYGEYEFKLDCESPYSESAPKLTVTFLPKCTVAVTRATAGGEPSMKYKNLYPLTYGGDYVIQGSSVTFTTTVATGYTFNHWYKRGSDVALSANTTYTTTIDESPVVMTASYTEIKYNVTVIANPASGGTVTPTEVTLMGQANGGSINATANPGYTFTNWSRASGSGNFSTTGTHDTWTYANTRYRPTSVSTIQANFTANNYTITLTNHGATTAGTTSVSVTFDATTGLTTGISVPSKTGYIFSGYYTGEDGTGTQLINSAGAWQTGNAWINGSSQWKNAGDVELHAKWTPKTTTITLDQTGRATAGSVTGTTGTYGSAMPDISGSGHMPTAQNGYAFMGYWDGENGNGTQYYNANGTSTHAWDKEDAAYTLHAYFKKAQITAITVSPTATVAPSTTITATATISPTPTGTTIVCWQVLHNNDNPLETQPTFSPESGASVSFTVPETSGTYKIEATLRTGDDCEAGTELSSQKVLFQVAGDHNVTVQYKCGTETIKASTSLEGIKPLEWSDEITPPDIFGYTFQKWEAEDGVSITTDNGTTTVTETTTATIKIKAIYDGRLVAKYTQNNIIYFKNTLGWSDVYVHFLPSSYWNNTNGSGNSGKANCNKHMTRIGETDVWYFDYGEAGISPSAYIAFTSASQNNYENFYAVSVVYTANYWQDQINTDKSSENGFKAATPMYVPLAGQTKTTLNNADYYNRGYWTKYTPGTGYSLKIYNSAGNALLKDIAFTSADELMPMTAVVDLEANTTYKYEMVREGDVYYGNDNTMNYSDHGQGTAWAMTEKAGGHKAGLVTTASGDYTFHLSYSENSSQEYRMRIAVDYPIADGDYRLIYYDAIHTKIHPSAIVPKVNNGKDTVSFFIRPANSPEMKIQQASVDGDGVITWSAGTDITSELTAIRCPKDSVYNICLTMNGSGVISVENVEGYTGNFYIRTDAETGSKWDNYKTPSHTMTYSQYSEENSDYTHYWMAHVWRNDLTNIKFVIANDYSPCISDTMIRSNYRGSDEAFVNEYGQITPEANIRFMWNKNDNSINRAYLSPAKSAGSKFLVLRGTEDDNLLSVEGNELDGTSSSDKGNNYGGGLHCMQFRDKENWIYEATVMVKPDSYVKLYARFAITVDGDGMPATYTDLYYKGDADGDDKFDGNDDDSDGIPNAIQLITGTGDHLLVRVIYDFKTDRLLAAYLPSGNITTEMDINADVMFIREHQGDISQVTFSGAGKITDIKTAYAVMRFNKWTLNNKSKTGSHQPLASPLSRYERDLFYISFPFDVNLNEVFGFGTYGTHWIIEEYDGAGRAQKGFWQDSPTFWKYITNRNGVVLHKNVGYLLALDLEVLGEDAPVWGVEENEIAELFFPSSGTMDDITSGSVTATLPEHTCTIVRNGSDRRIADSHWNIMGVPTYVNTKNISFANTTWTTGSKDPEAGKLGPKFLYTWNPDDNSLTATTARGFMYHAMHAYTVQYYGDVTWESSVSVTPSPIVSRERQAPTEYEWCLELQQNDQMIDRTYVRMSNEEEVTTGFEFGYDMSKNLNKNRTNIYSFIGTDMIAGNSMPIQTEQTTIVPIGVSILSAGDYTFAMPDGTNGVGVTLVDTEANIRTSLSALDYTVNLSAGQYDSRFVLEISPVQEVITDIPSTGDGMNGTSRKVLIDGILYIVRDGKIYDARGARIE
ncbi:MAG: hypothetical protein II825_06015 [Paludibacteraceae bacterium]|nr:hypothetical protein [Paludibacteraceae bacterium]